MSQEGAPRKRDVTDLTVEGIFGYTGDTVQSIVDSLTPEQIHDQIVAAQNRHDRSKTAVVDAQVALVNAQSNMLRCQEELALLLRALQLAQDKNPGI